MAGLLLSLVAAAAAAAWVLLDTGYRVDTTGQPAPEARPAAAAAVLRDLAAALEAGDPDAAAALAPPGDTAAGRLLAGVARNADRLRLEGVSLRYVDEDGPVGADGSWPAVAELRWRLGGLAERAATADVAVDLAQDGDEVYLTGLGGHDRRTPVWFAGPARVFRSGGTVLVVSEALGPTQARRYRDLVADAVPRVARTVRHGRAGLVVQVPAEAAGVDAALGAEAGTYARVAAVTGTADGGRDPRAPVRVLVNPEEMERLGRRGARVVVSHEAAHVALGAAVSTGRLPPWLVEGTADYVALRDVPLPLTTTLRQALVQVRRDGPPARLPGAAELDSVSGEHLGAAYELSWFACLLVAERAGADGLLAVYADVESGVPLDAALRVHAGLDEAGLTATWRRRLAALAG